MNLEYGLNVWVYGEGEQKKISFVFANNFPQYASFCFSTVQ